MHHALLQRSLAAVILLWGIAVLSAVCPAAERKKISLVGKDLSTWRGETGDWMIAGEVKLDPANTGQLATRRGTGVLVNGPKGRTRRCIPSG